MQTFSLFLYDTMSFEPLQEWESLLFDIKFAIIRVIPVQLLHHPSKERDDAAKNHF